MASYSPTGTTQSFKSSLYLVNTNNTLTLADGALAQYNDMFHNGVTWEDAIKFTNINESLSFLRDGISLAIERRPVIMASDTLFFKLIQTTPRKYRFVFTAEKMDNPGLVAVLEDSYTGVPVVLNLHAENTIDFVIDNNIGSKASDRFRIVFKVLDAGTLPVSFNQFRAWQQNTGISLEWKVENEYSIRQYIVERSADARNFTRIAELSARGSNGGTFVYNWFDINPLKGDSYYRIRSVETNGKTAYSTVVRMSTGKQSPRIVAYPNPVTGGTTGLQLRDIVAGNYEARLIAVSGVVVARQTISHAGGNTTAIFNPGQSLSKGIYRLEISQGNKIVTSLALYFQ